MAHVRDQRTQRRGGPGTARSRRLVLVAVTAGHRHQHAEQQEQAWNGAARQAGHRGVGNGGNAEATYRPLRGQGQPGGAAKENPAGVSLAGSVPAEPEGKWPCLQNLRSAAGVGGAMVTARQS